MYKRCFFLFLDFGVHISDDNNEWLFVISWGVKNKKIKKKEKLLIILMQLLNQDVKKKKSFKF